MTVVRQQTVHLATTAVRLAILARRPVTLAAAVAVTDSEFQKALLIAKAQAFESAAKRLKSTGAYTGDNIKLWMLQIAANYREQSDEITPIKEK